jgi:hypothetical protein
MATSQAVHEDVLAIFTMLAFLSIPRPDFLFQSCRAPIGRAGHLSFRSITYSTLPSRISDVLNAGFPRTTTPLDESMTGEYYTRN